MTHDVDNDEPKEAEDFSDKAYDLLAEIDRIHGNSTNIPATAWLEEFNKLTYPLFAQIAGLKARIEELEQAALQRG